MTLPSTFPRPRILDQTSAPSLRWGILGPGHIASAWVQAVKRFTNQRVVAVGSRSLDRASAFASRFEIPVACGSYEELLARPDVDAVYVAVPSTQHLAYGLMAIAAGKHVLIEKPLAPTAADAQTLTSAARAAGVFLMEGMWTRYLPQADVIRQLVSDGVLGELQVFLADHGRALVTDPLHVDAGISALDGMGIYPIALSSELLGPPVDILAQGLLAPSGADLYATVAFSHEGGAHSAISTSIVTRTPIAATIAGSAARIDIHPPAFTPTSFTLSTPEKISRNLEWAEPTGMTFYDGLSWEATALAGFAADGQIESPLHTHAETVSILETIDEARRQLSKSESARRTPRTSPDKKPHQTASPVSTSHRPQDLPSGDHENCPLVRL